jgi:hypothetical protein
VSRRAGSKKYNKNPQPHKKKPQKTPQKQRPAPDLADGAGNDRLEHRAAVVVKKMDFVDDDKANQSREPALIFAGDNVPLLGGTHNHLARNRLLNLLIFL